MAAFSIANGSATTFTDTTPGTGVTIDFAVLDNSFNVQVNGVDLFVGGPSGAPTELEFQTASTSGQTVRFADGDEYGSDTPEIWQLSNSGDDPVVRLVINPDGTIELYGVKANNGALEPLELHNGMTVNSAAIAAAWNDSGSNVIVIDQILTGPTNASGEIEDVPCFAAGTLIETTDGPVLIENLKAGDQVLTFDNGCSSVRWIGSCELSPAQLQAHPNLRPIVIRADALGRGYPKQDLVVSRQHRVLVSSPIAKRMFGDREVLIPANKLLALDGVEVVEHSPKGVTYWHMLFDSHEIVFSNGAPTESLYTGPGALSALSGEARSEILALFPEICEPSYLPASAYHMPSKGRQAKKLIERHQANSQPLLCCT